MSAPAGAAELLESTRRYLAETLLPFWITRSPDPAHGGFLSYLDRDGAPTGETDKTLLMQVRILFAMARAHRAGLGGGRCAELARDAADFVLRNYWDDEHGGWFWLADRAGRPKVRAKIGYGQFLAMYALAEHVLATGDPRSREAMLRTCAVVEARMADRVHGGYLEIMDADWSPAQGGRHGGDRKSLDVHMHAMEALTAVLEVTGEAAHRERLLEVIALIRRRMLVGERGVGLMQFALDLSPLAPIRLQVEWGSDEEPEGGAFPLDTTSYGHNVELAWLLLHAGDVLGQHAPELSSTARVLLDHCLEFGLDRRFGGVYVDGPTVGPPSNPHKQFWQQAEVLVGMLDGHVRFGDQRYWDAFRNVHDFVFTHLVNWKGGGEWCALLDRDGTPIWNYQGHGYKVCYHTIRAMVEVVARLEAVVAAS